MKWNVSFGNITDFWTFVFWIPFQCDFKTVYIWQNSSTTTIMTIITTSTTASKISNSSQL
ncbi:hypothetical protein DERF_009930 [Dermatophagoides farinae]|uniref:Uncharacterized protein n=1 Tax=Dermatophagoides farinae TaxID=6954 RepID=A0A922HVY5_DERFA|nr:hypothetical protein DERF_009930 [Dermatophagoides farinae]